LELCVEKRSPFSLPRSELHAEKFLTSPVFIAGSFQNSIAAQLLKLDSAHPQAAERGVRALAQLGFDAIAVPRRARYFAFRGRRAERRAHRAQIAQLIRPYPKRPGAIRSP
jgi:hypothetical protein